MFLGLRLVNIFESGEKPFGDYYLTFRKSRLMTLNMFFNENTLVAVLFSFIESKHHTKPFGVVWLSD